MVENNVLEKIPNNIIKTIAIVNQNGYEAYLVGGAVRDILMQKEPKDYDICSSATTEQIKSIFPNHFCLGEKFGTISIIMDDDIIEITTLRKDSTYSDGRHPDSVEFCSSIEEDLSRRDFTMNAIAFSPSTGFVDPFNGWLDIKNKLIVAVGNPTDRFNEDGLRIMRAMRFSSRLGFEIENKTHQAMLECKDNLKKISKERLSSELIKILKGNNVLNVMTLNSSIISVIIPEYELVVNCPQQNPYHIYSLIEHTLKVVENIADDDILKLSAFFHDFGKPYVRYRGKNGIDRFSGHADKSVELTTEIMKGMKFDNKTIKDVTLLIKYHDSLWNPTESNIKRIIGIIGLELFDKLTILRVSDVAAQAPREDASVNKAISIRNKIIAENLATKSSDLAIDGFDIIKLLNIKPSAIIGQLIKDVLDLVIEGKCENESEALKEMVQKLYNNRDVHKH